MTSRVETAWLYDRLDDNVLGTTVHMSFQTSEATLLGKDFTCATPNSQHVCPGSV